jgi:HEAT repeat protein
MEVRRSAALGLGRHAAKGDAVACKKLIRTYKFTGDHALKGFCLIALGQVGGDDAVKALSREASLGQSSLCPWACVGLGLALREKPNASEEQVLLRQLEARASRSTKSAAALGLGLAGSKAAVPVLIRFLKEGDDPFFRGYCALALGLIHDPKALEPLREALLQENTPPQVEIQAAVALAHMKDRTAAQDLLDLLLKTPNFAHKAYLAQGLGFMSQVSLARSILDHLVSTEKVLDDQTRACCVLLLARILSGRTVPFLEPLAAGSNFVDELPIMKTLLSLGI